MRPCAALPHCKREEVRRRRTPRSKRAGALQHAPPLSQGATPCADVVVVAAVVCRSARTGRTPCSRASRTRACGGCSACTPSTSASRRWVAPPLSPRAAAPAAEPSCAVLHPPPCVRARHPTPPPLTAAPCCPVMRACPPTVPARLLRAERRGEAGARAPARQPRQALHRTVLRAAITQQSHSGWRVHRPRIVHTCRSHCGHGVGAGL